MRIRTAVRVAAMVAAVLGPSGAAAQSSIYDGRGVKENRAYQALAPFEQVDTLSGNLMLSFIDLELPGDGGYSLRIQRVYNAKSAGEGPSRWTFGLADVPMMVRFPDGAPIGTPPHPDPDFYNPRLLTADGGEHRTAIAFHTPGSLPRYRTSEFWEYRMDDHRVALPNGLECQYDALGFLTQITSPYGVVADIYWDGTPPANPLVPQRALTQITQHVGGTTRAITFTTDAGIWPLPRTMTFGSRQWRYEGGPAISGVQLPDGGRWNFELLSPTGDLRVTTPNGGQTEYYFGSHPFRYVPDTTNPEYSTVLLRRVVKARPDRDEGGTWYYAYPGPDAPARITIVDDPSANRMAYFYTLTNDRPRLTRVETFEWNGSGFVLVRAEERGYVARAYGIGGTQSLLARVKVTQDGRQYETLFTYSDANWSDYGQPYRIDESGHFSRVTLRTFETAFRTPFSGAYLPGLVHQESLTVGSETFTKTFDHQPGTGFRTHETVHAIERWFEPDGRGNVERETDAVGLSTRYSYVWGVRQNTYTPEYTITRQIDADSTVASETRNGYTTSFQYDGLFRRTRVQPPAGTPTVTTFDPAGQWMTVRRASGATFAETTYTLDGMGRVIHERNTLGVNNHYAYDALGRREFATLPFYDNQAWPTTSWDYDALNRVRFETYPDGYEKRFTYPNGNVRVVDEQDRVTTYEWQASGDPSNRRLASVTDADGQQFRYSYNGLNRLTRVDQPGGSSSRAWGYTPGTELLVSETHPESGTTTYFNDAAGRLRTRRDASGRSHEYHYDGNNRLVHIDVEGGTEYDTFFDYDDADNRKVARNSVVTSEFLYDGANRLTSRSDKFPALALPFTTGYTYTDLDAIDRLTYPSGTVIDYDYDREGRLAVVTRVSGGGGELMRVLAHHASGAPLSMRFGNGKEELRTFDERHRPDTVTIPDLALDYNYYPAGNVSAVVDHGRAGFTQTFEYDNLDRVKRYQRGATTNTFTYDALGNRTFGPLGAQTYNPLTLHMNGFPYGARGQMQNDGQAGYTYTKTVAAMLETATVNGVVTTYRYDADDLRKITIPASGLHEYVIHGQGPQVLTEGAVSGAAASWTRDYVYAGSQLVAALRAAPPAPPKPIVGFSVASQQVSEGPGASVNVTICVDTRGAATLGTPVDITFNTQNGSAIANADYAPLQNFVVTIPGSATSGCNITAPIGITNDAVTEGTESYSLSMTVPPQQADVSIGTQTITILDDDAGQSVTLAFDPSSTAVSEAAGQVLVTLRVTTSNGQPTTSLIRVYAFTADSTATQGTDYQPVAGTLDIAAGTPHNTPLQAWLPIVNDALDEADELFGIALTPVIGNPTFGTPLHIYIIDDDSTGATMQMDFSVAQMAVAENAGSVPVTFRITTATGAPVAGNVGFSYATVQETATPNVDYAHAAGGGVIFAGTANESRITVNLPIGNDNVPEGLETFRIEIGLAPPGTSQIPMMRVGIFDDDGAAFSTSTETSGAGAAPSGNASTPLPSIGEWQTLSPPSAAPPPPLIWTVRPTGSEPLLQPRKEQ